MRERAYGTTTPVSTVFAYDDYGRLKEINAGSGLVHLAYEYVPKENNIEKIFFHHRGPTVYNQYGYDDIDRLTTVEYHNSDTEDFVMDDLGNRTGDQTLRGEGTVHFAVEPLTNRYTAVAGSPLAYDDAGNLTQDHDGYRFAYDYENRIIEVRNSSNALVAEFDYDTQGRRIRVYDAVADSTTLYYYSDNWQVLSTYVGGSLDKSFFYGNYIDEVLVMNQGANDYFYLHDHLFSPAALLDNTGSVVERYEYDAYGSCRILDSNFDIRISGLYGNPYAFTGRELDVLDGGALHHMHYRHRDYSPILARFFQPDPKGYVDSMSLYAYVINNPIILLDPYGTKSTDSYLRRQVDAYFSNIGSYFLGTDIYSITGLDQLISKLSLVKIDKFKESGDSPEFVVTYRNKTIMRLIKLEEEDFKRSLLTNKHESTFHEFVHAYLYSIGLYQPEVWHEDRNNEGIAYASHELYGWVIDFRAFIEKKIEILESNPSKEEREEALKLLKTEWPRAWARLNSYRSWSGRTNYSPPDGYGFDPGRYFNITTMDISRVRKHLGFSISCDSLAERYNKRIEGLEGCECVKFKCKIGNPNAPEIWLSEPLDRIFE